MIYPTESVKLLLISNIHYLSFEVGIVCALEFVLAIRILKLGVEFLRALQDQRVDLPPCQFIKGFDKIIRFIIVQYRKVLKDSSRDFTAQIYRHPITISSRQSLAKITYARIFEKLFTEIIKLCVGG